MVEFQKAPKVDKEGSDTLIQKIKTPRKSKSYLVSKNEVVNPGKLNMLEYVVVCVIVLFCLCNRSVLMCH